jgi:hypothetical protein
MHYFCGNAEIPTDLQEREPQRAALYKATASLVRAYANIADELEAAGYSSADIARIRQQLDHYLRLREIIRKASAESLDLKSYEADMRHLIDTYIQADEPRKISPFDDMSLLELIVNTGIAEAIAQQLGALQGNKNAVAETGVSANLLYGCEQLNRQNDSRRAGIWLCGSAAHLVRLEEERWRDGQAEGLGRLQVEDPLEPHDLLHRQGARCRTLSQVSPAGRDPAVPLMPARAVRHEPSKLCPCPVHG